MAVDFNLKAHDTLPELECTLLDANNNPVDLTTATSIRFHMLKKGDETLTVDEDAVIVGAPTIGRVKYSWQAGDTDDAGEYDGEFQVTFSSGGVATFPNKRNLSISILEDLD